MLIGIVFQTLLQKLSQGDTRCYASEQISLVIISNAYKWRHKGSKRNATLRSMTSLRDVLTHFQIFSLGRLG